MTFSRATQQRVDQAGRATSTATDIVSADPNATMEAIAERAAEQILSCVDNNLRRRRSDTRVSRHGPIPAPPDERPADGGRRAESWFLERGLPSMLTRRARWRRLWPRCAPMLAAYATQQACVLPIYLITGGHDVEITGEPTTSELIVLSSS